MPAEKDRHALCLTLQLRLKLSGKSNNHKENQLRHPDKKSTGCAAQIDPDTFGQMPEVDHVIGNEEKLKPDIWSKLPDERLIVNDIMNVKETAPQLVSGFKGRFRAFAQIQQGCDHRCTFCIIPYGRGNSRSVAIGEIVKQVRLLLENGYREFVLTGVDITSYGSDWLVNTIWDDDKTASKNVEGIERLRLSSLDPAKWMTICWI